MEACASVRASPGMEQASRPTKRSCRATSNTKGAAMDRRAFLTGAAAMSLGAAAYGPALGQSFPSNVIRTIVPGSVSTPPDILARIVASGLSDGEGWNVIVEDKPGAMMMLGA